jgi:hypothetical protein
VYISDAVVPAATFCDIHVIELIPGEQRFIAAYYSQGIKIVDYFVDDQGRVTFEEVSSVTFPAPPESSNTWAAEQFKIVDNPDGTRTYFIAADDIYRGIDILSWTGEPNPIGAEPPEPTVNTTEMNLGLIGLAALVLPAAAALGRHRRRRRSVV